MLLWVLAAALAISAQAPAPAGAATNGRIAFEVSRDSSHGIATINPDGTNPAPAPGVPTDSANAAWSADGTQLAFSSTISGRWQIYVINQDGTGLRRITDDPVAAIDPTWSPDGRFIAFTSLSNGAPDIYVTDLRRGTFRRLTTDPAIDQQAKWSPDGQLIAFVSNRAGSLGVWTMAPDGSDQRPVTSQPGVNADPAWSPDGARLAYMNDQNGFRSLNSISRSGGASTALTRGHGTDEFPAWSPDGTQIAFTRDGALYVMPSSGELQGGTARFLAQPGVDPVWAALPVPTVARATEGVTVMPPGSTGQSVPISTAPALPTGTRVNATGGAVVVSFERPAAPASVPPSTALIQDAVFGVVRRTPETLWLRLRTPVCASRAVAAARRPRRRAKARVRRGHFGFITNQVIAASHLTDYVVAVSCRGTLVKVTKGLVVVQLRRGRRRTVRVRAGHSYFAPARRG